MNTSTVSLWSMSHAPTDTPNVAYLNLPACSLHTLTPDLSMMMMMMQETFLVALLVLATSVHSNSQFYLPIDCDDIYRHDNKSSSGVYTIYPGGPTAPLRVYCDMDTDGGGWTVFQRRLDGTESFFRPWAHYKTGFGNVAGEYWLGLENIFLLSARKKNELRVDMEDWEGGRASAQYASFSIESENTGYQLNLGSFTGGAAGDSLSNHNSMKFTTYDKDHDEWDKNCAQHFLGGFWYKACHMTNPTGMYAPHGAIGFENAQSLWHAWKGWNYSLKSIAMKIRSVARCVCTHGHDQL
ncbi:microfibril-associated glycoprotein 4-like [Parambassis ranga]|uniref:Microfibril-associated glycoprotein 4-like n=1 Tax=Parambassis ranga TaxID=210632 RepID=A0A6P7HZ13_9TELE|nr:microfibril-associated glycoprotein 4-like [Parambassis ranga]